MCNTLGNFSAIQLLLIPPRFQSIENNVKATSSESFVLSNSNVLDLVG